jgi:pyruvate dehydrogenase E2 component (dihydrolipoamide acetyltransferase)
MYADVVLPNLGFGMEEGRLIAWLKSAGDAVRKGEPIAEIESDKATVELEALVDGVLEQVMFSPDTVVPVGAVLARIRTDQAMPVPTTATPVSSSPSPVLPAAPAAPPQAEPESFHASPVALRLAREHGIDLAAIVGTGPGGRITREDVQSIIDKLSSSNGVSHAKVLAAPAVRKFARDKGIDLTTVRGTGKDGRITRPDVEARVAVPAPSVAGERTEVTLTKMRQAIARSMSRSMQDAPHFYVTGELDFTDAIAATPKEVGINALLLYLAVQTLKEVPELNATYEQDQLYHYPFVNLALAVALPDGLITPVLAHADDYSLSGLAARSKELVARARSGNLRADELSGGTFTVSNLGVVQQVEQFTAIVNPPQVAILAAGAVKERPVVINGGLYIRTTAHLTVSADHRVLDGLVLARFLETFDKQLKAFSS